MVQIAINEKKVEFTTIEALRIHGETYQIHEQLRAVGKFGVPVIFNRGRVYDGSTQCIKFVDYEFEPYDVLMPIKNSVDINDAVEFVHESIAHPYYKMLFRQTEDLQDKEKQRILDNAYILSQQVRFPFFSGEQFTIADITIAPYFERMLVLEHYRNFKIPEDDERYSKWNEWKKNVLARQSVIDTLQKDKNKLLSAYERYAKDIVRNNWYKRIQEEDEKAKEDYLKPLHPRFEKERKKWLKEQ